MKTILIKLITIYKENILIQEEAIIRLKKNSAYEEISQRRLSILSIKECIREAEGLINEEKELLKEFYYQGSGNTKIGHESNNNIYLYLEPNADDYLNDYLSKTNSMTP